MKNLVLPLSCRNISAMSTVCSIYMPKPFRRDVRRPYTITSRIRHHHRRHDQRPRCCCIPPAYHRRVLSSYHSFSSSTSDPSVSLLLLLLSKWKRIVSDIPPPGLTNDQKGRLKVQAFVGDTLLNCAVVTRLEATAVDTNNYDSGSLTKMKSDIVSNQFLAKHAAQILPPTWSIPDVDQKSDWDIGTVVEAAVSLVHQKDPRAVDELADFLLRQYEHDTDVKNFKGSLLELGGSVSSRRIGGLDNNPIFTATATLDDKTSTAKGSSKKRAEMTAAAQVMSDAGNDTTTLEGRPTTTVSWQPDELAYHEWKPIIIPTDDLSLELEQDETPLDWWLSKATTPKKSFFRAYMSPAVFPETIQSFNAWMWRHESPVATEAAVLGVVVTTTGTFHTIPAKMDCSGKKAQKLIGLEANRIIAELVGVKLPEMVDEDNNEDATKMNSMA
mmetsp:Transcript_21651/g.51143  ORF Transcript_21651/g.51143 Transcript_21651/m.51143 type:complete len:442 (+) Transcript_21651:334-1659(+)